MKLMTLYNNTPGEVFFGIESASSGDCGTIESGGTSDWPAYDNQDNVKVTFAATPVSTPPDVTPFKVTIPESGTGMAVTIGIYQE
jgi:hypothetical protein